MESTTIFESLLTEFQTVLILLERPIVQLQIGTIIAIILLCWAASVGSQRTFLRRDSRLAQRFSHNIAQLGRRYLFLPTLLFLSLFSVTLLFRLNHLPTSILQNGIIVMLGVLIYYAGLVWAYNRYNQKIVKLYHRLIFLPTLLAILAYSIISRSINLSILGEVPVLPFLSSRLTVEVLGQVVLIIYLFSAIAYLIRQAQRRADGNDQTDSAAISSILIVSRYAVIGLGVLAVGATLGINFATLAVIGGGLSIGIGFGLQQIVANFISGIFLLFEQSLRPGDVIDIDGQLGLVHQVDIRSTTILTQDHIEIIVPNEKLLTNEVTTYTRGSNLVRVHVEFGVSYDSDPQLVRELVIRTVAKHGSVKQFPTPEVYFMGFGASNLDFQVLVWMERPLTIPRFRSDLYFMIWESFKKNGIEIPFPQRDIHIRTPLEQSELVEQDLSQAETAS